MKDVSSAADQGTVLVSNTGSGLAPSYGRGVILFSSKESFKALLVDDDTDGLYLWSCHKKQTTDIIAKTVEVIKIV